jgi:hypothetical protein
VTEFAAHVAALLRSPREREVLSAHGAGDAARWSAPALMQQVVQLYASLGARRTDVRADSADQA